jgi:hypothetical protein
MSGWVKYDEMTVNGITMHFLQETEEILKPLESSAFPNDVYTLRAICISFYKYGDEMLK